MTQADCVFITPPTDTSRLQNILEQEAARQASLAVVRRLRREAAAEIERLLAFMDASDTYVMTEREENGDEADASFLNSGSYAVYQNEDDEDSDPPEEDDALEDGHDREGDRSDHEPLLGWTEQMAQGVDHGGGQDLEIGT